MRIASIPTFHLDGEVATAFDGLCVQKNGRRYFSDLLEGPQDFLVEGNLLDEGEKQWLKDHAIEPQQGWCIYPEAATEMKSHHLFADVLLNQRFRVMHRSTYVVIQAREEQLIHMMWVYLLATRFCEQVQNQR